MAERSLARELAEAISSGEAVPGSGWVAGVSAALAAALVAKTAKRSEGWSESSGPGRRQSSCATGCSRSPSRTRWPTRPR